MKYNTIIGYSLPCKSPKERLIELQKLYNSQSGSMYSDELKRNMQCWLDEMNKIISDYPELAPIKLKQYEIPGGFDIK